MNEGRPEVQERWIRQIVEAHERRLIAYATRLIGDAGWARDVVQEAFLRLVREPGAPRARPAPWLFLVCRNLALDVRRKEQRVNPLPETMTDDESSRTPGPVQALDHAETSQRIVRCLDRLPESQQEVLRLKFQGDLTYREIADVTGRSVTNVGVLIHQGIRALRDLVSGARARETLS